MGWVVDINFGFLSSGKELEELQKKILKDLNYIEVLKIPSVFLDCYRYFLVWKSFFWPFKAIVW